MRFLSTFVAHGFAVCGLLGCGAAEPGTTPAPGDGDTHLQIAPTYNLCPRFAQSLVIPQAIKPRMVAEVVVIATDPDGLDSALAYDWSASSGSFTDPKQPTTGYGCVERGRQVLRLDASDALGCRAALNLEVTCLE